MTTENKHETHYGIMHALADNDFTDLGAILGYFYDCNCGHGGMGFETPEEMKAAAAEHIERAVEVRVITTQDASDRFAECEQCSESTPVSDLSRVEDYKGDRYDVCPPCSDLTHFEKMRQA